MAWIVPGGIPAWVVAGALQRLRAQSAEAPLPPAVVLERLPKTRFIEVRPQAVAEVQFGECGFPEQKVAEPPFIAGADQQIDGARRMIAVIGFEQQAMKVIGCQLRAAGGEPGRLQDAVL